MDRRRSTRLSGENAANGGAPTSSIIPSAESSSSTRAAAIPKSGNEAVGGEMSGSGSGMQEVAGGDDVGEPAKKKQKTATSLNVCFLKDCEGPFACSARS
jgi:hypothetical protein